MRHIAACAAAALAFSAGAAAASSRSVVVVGAERDVDSFNVAVSCCGNPWDSWLGPEEALRGAFVQAPDGRWHPAIVTAASADARGVTYTIDPRAAWYWGGRRVPVTYRDFVYTLRQLDDPSNDVADRSGYDQLDPAHFTHSGLREVRFLWRTRGCGSDTPCGPYGAWQSLFATVYPSFALRGLPFDTMWQTCICGSDGKPVADGPYYLASYTPGSGAVLRANPYWAGVRPRIREIDFRIVSDPSAEVQAVESHAVQVVAPTYGQYLEPLKNAAGLRFSESPGPYLEHVLFREGAGASNLLLRAPFMRAAIAMAIDRNAIIDTVFGDLAGPVQPPNDALFYHGEKGYNPDFRRWNYNPRRARALLAKHCTGGPAAVDPTTTSVWQCSGLTATFEWTWPSGDTARNVIDAIAKEQLRAVGIGIVDQPRQPPDFFGSAGVSSGRFDVAEFAEATNGDPGAWAASYTCAGAANITGFCSRSVDALFARAGRDLVPASRTRIYEAADRTLAKLVPLVPLYERPDILVTSSALAGVVSNAMPSGPFWNVEDWKWTR